MGERDTASAWAPRFRARLRAGGPPDPVRQAAGQADRVPVCACRVSSQQVSRVASRRAATCFPQERDRGLRRPVV